ncbi:hypothetical protein [Streptomyces sp. CB03911]|uniref:hypothetical protein n=1 Tax=Streptomyces sp. CB03911 TaxID=1804758 RepID=UPI00093D13F9|nr:hypothetical protein [Streptomyces sp. CB03911]OKI16641.1 hypothetical protein A6A07_11580 [Streptomyces sp. CB03911]
MPDLTIIVPTRSRPGNLWELWCAFKETSTADTVLLAAVDDDDPFLLGYEQRLDWADGDPRLQMQVGPRLRLGGTLNALAPTVAAGSRHIGFLGDDHRPRTVGWDGQYIEALDQLGTGLVYGNDLIQGASLPTQVAMTSDIVLATGYMVPPGLVHLWADNVWLTLGQALGAIRYLPDVVVEHMHPIAGKAEYDEGYAECNTDERSDADRAVFEAWRANDLARWVQQIKEYPRG